MKKNYKKKITNIFQKLIIIVFHPIHINKIIREKMKKENHRYRERKLSKKQNSQIFFEN